MRDDRALKRRPRHTRLTCYAQSNVLSRSDQDFPGSGDILPLSAVFTDTPAIRGHESNTLREADDKIVRAQLFPNAEAAMEHAYASGSARRQSRLSS